MNTRTVSREQIFRQLALIPQERLNEVDAFIRFVLFQTKTQPDKSQPDKPRKFGFGKNIVRFVSDDFNEPIDDFKEYMQ